MSRKYALRKKDAEAFIKQMKTARQTKDVEKAVEKATMTLLHTYFQKKYRNAQVVDSYPYKTDGLVTISDPTMGNSFSILVEAKRTYEFSARATDIPRVLAQVVYYLHSFIQDGAVPPKVIVCVDLDEIFAVPSATLLQYAFRPYDWNIAPSAAGDITSQLYQDLLADSSLNGIFVHTIDENFDAREFCEDLNNKATLVEPTKIPVTAESMQKVFYNFITTCLGAAAANLPSQRQREIFIRSLKGDEEVYRHPKKKNTLIVDGDEINGVDVRRYEAFWLQYDTNYSLAELDQITAMGDTLIEETERRFSGDFWTPQHWVDQANKTIEEALGTNWRDEYTVWDPACGSLNLTREGKFKRLFASTLFDSELAIAEEYNRNAVKFQYDFLNDDVDYMHMGNPTAEQVRDWASTGALKIPQLLIEALYNNAPIVIFTNPPYAQATTGTRQTKSGVADTKVRHLMGALGSATNELYAQFLYRVQKLAELFGYTENFHLFFFTGAVFLSGDSFSKFRQGFFSTFEQKTGFLINSGEFHGTSKDWGIVFSHFELNPGANQENFEYKILEADKNLEISHTGNWVASVVNKKDSIKAFIPPVTTEKDYDAPITRNGIDAPTSDKIRGIPNKNWIGYLSQDASRISGSEKYTTIYTTAVARGNGVTITKDNFVETATVFSICRALYDDIEAQGRVWARKTDIIRKPSPHLAANKEFLADCVVLSIFERKARQYSLRDYQYKGTTYDVNNEFFWMSPQEIQALAEKHKLRDIEADLIGAETPYLHEWLQENSKHLSEEAKTVLAIATTVLQDSFSDRILYHNDPRYTRLSLVAWDAGWEQIRKMCFSESRISDAYLHYRPDFDAAVAVLKQKIADAAYNDGVLPR